MGNYSDLGGFFIIFFSEGLNPNAVAGGPSVTKLTLNFLIKINERFYKEII